VADVVITIRPTGPYLVQGPIELRDAGGNVLQTGPTIALCRCGASTTKPFCDGTHSKIGFLAADLAVDEG
jgi:3-phenylpropionate/trans-cinnamate dioxygenase ferredoxin subunit